MPVKKTVKPVKPESETAKTLKKVAGGHKEKTPPKEVEKVEEPPQKKGKKSPPKAKPEVTEKPKPEKKKRVLTEEQRARAIENLKLARERKAQLKQSKSS